MKTRIILLSATLILLMPSTSFCQVGNILRNRVNKAINKRIEDKVDTAINKRVEEATQEQNAGTQPQGAETPQRQGAENINLGNLLGGKITAKYSEAYNFNNRIYMVTEMYDKKDVVRSDMYVYFNDSSTDGGFEAKLKGTSDGEQMEMAMTSVYDAVNKVFIVLSDMGAMKIGLISEVPEETAESQASVQKRTRKGTSEVVITKTRNSKIIAGLKCDEYLYNDPETKEHGNLWVTRDLKLYSDKRVYSKGGAPMYYDHPDLADGAVLAMESYNEKNELQLRTDTKEITRGLSHTISVAGYPLRQVNFDQAGGTGKK